MVTQKPTILLLGTHNAGKLLKMRHGLALLHYSLPSLADVGITAVAPETGLTLEDNACQKAAYYGTLTGLTTLVDDSGLFIDALEGRPGIHTAHYAGINVPPLYHMNRILEEMTTVSGEKRTATFVSVLALWRPDGFIKTFRGSLAGLITNNPRAPLIQHYPTVKYFLCRRMVKH